MREIIEILQADGLASPERIAKMTGLDAEQVRDQIAAWENAGIIRRYKAVVDLDQMRTITGTEVITAMIDVSLSPARSRHTRMTASCSSRPRRTIACGSRREAAQPGYCRMPAVRNTPLLRHRRQHGRRNLTGGR